MGFFLRFRRALMQAKYRPESRRIDVPAAALPYAYWSEKRPLRLEVPVGMLRMPGAFAYGPDHPFRRGLAEGAPALRAFYDGFQPRDLAGMYGLDMVDETGAGLPVWEYPWRLYDPRKPPRGEKGLSAKHGVAHYGPCSDRKVAQEISRLNKALAGIKQHGYDPDRFGDIEGQLITDGERVAFLIMGGKHRAAVLAHIGETHVPVRLRAGRMPLVDTRTAENWPLVANGEVSRKLACAIAGVYLDGRVQSDVGG